MTSKTFIDASDTLAEAILNSKRVIINNSGHLCTMEKPEQVNLEILSLLEKVE